MPSMCASRDDRIEIRAHGRIHFGLVEISESEPNCFGGIGLMIEHSEAVIQGTVGICQSGQLKIEGDSYWTPRIDAISQQWLQTHEHLPIQSVTVINSPLPHQGLGSGTQVASSIAALLISGHEMLSGFERDALARCPQTSMQAISQLGQRGKRSHIGLRGFLEGGFVIDNGKHFAAARDLSLSSRTERFEFPDWPVIVIQDRTSVGDFGTNESEMFDRCKQHCNPNRIPMLQLIHQEILPAIQANDWDQWNVALGRYGQWAGMIFEIVQGGIYRTTNIAKTIEVANSLGLLGTVQSSWGPAVCAIAKDEEHASWCASRLKTELPHAMITVTKAANRPAQLYRL